MSKLIVEMEMPVKEWNCLDCKAICADLMRGHYCGITKKTIDTLKNMRARPDWCPIKGEISDIELMHLEEERAFAARNIAAESEADADYQLSVLMQEHFERYEPTYNSEDGSM